MSASKCFILFVFVAQLVDNLTCMPVNENNYRSVYKDPYGSVDGGFDGSHFGAPAPSGGALPPGFDPNTGNIQIGTGYIPPIAGGSTGTSGTGGGFDSGFDGSHYKPIIGGFDHGFDGSHLGGRPSGGFDHGFDGSHLGGRPSSGFDSGFDGSNLGRPGGSLNQKPNFDVRSG